MHIMYVGAEYIYDRVDNMILSINLFNVSVFQQKLFFRRSVKKGDQVSKR